MTINTTWGLFRDITSPDVIQDKDGTACDFQLDLIDNVVWLAPGLSPSRRELVLRGAIKRLHEFLDELKDGRATA